MTLRLLPPLLGLPWEVRDPSVRPTTLSPFVAVGSPLYKTLGQSVTVNWPVRNDGNVTGYALLTLRTHAGLEVARIGPVGVLPGSQVTLSASWRPPAGSYVLGISVEEATQTGQQVRQIAQDAASVDVVAPAPPPPPAAPSLVVVGSPTIS